MLIGTSQNSLMVKYSLIAAVMWGPQPVLFQEQDLPLKISLVLRVKSMEC